VALDIMAMNLNSTNIREKIKRDDNAIDYSVIGLAVPLQFVISNEPHLPRNREQEKLVRSHGKRQSRAVEKRRNTCRFRDEKFSNSGSTNRQINQSSASQKQMRTSSRVRANHLQNQKLLLLSVLVRNSMHISRQSQVGLLVRIAKLEHTPPLQN
jgi:hypothetical protein